MKPITSYRLQAAEELLQNKKFKDAIVKLREIDLDSISPEERAFANLLLAEANLYLGNYHIEDNLNYALNYYRNSPENDKFARAKFLHGLLLVSLGKLFEAKEVLLESYTGYKRCDDLSGEARVLNRLSFIAYHVGDIEAAISHLQKCHDIYRNRKDYKSMIAVSINLSQLYFAAGRIRDSIIQYEKAKSEISDVSSKDAGIFYFMSAIPRALKGDIKTALQTIKKATLYLDGYAREQAIYHENLGWIHLLKEDYNNAEKALLKGLKLSLEIAPESALVSQIKRRLGDACLGQGKFGRAKTYADEALAVSEKINERIEIAACYRIYAQLENINGNNDKAREWFKKAIEIFAIIGSRYELAATRYLTAISGLYQNGERQALLYLAREYFESEGILPFLKKINAEMKLTRRGTWRPADSHGEEPKIITINPAMKKLVDLAGHVAKSEMSVLLTGPTGTGKDLFARYIHYHSGRIGGFIPVNTAATPDNMIEAELFGYRKGAYTGADRDKIGLIEEADGGTLYLNEVADASPEFQAKLLDVLERRKIRRLGETKERRVAFRLIAATNHDLERRIREGKFRADLYHRLCEIPITLPPLCDRLDDIPALLAYFLNMSDLNTARNDCAGAFDRLVRVLSADGWPGNIRQFKAEVKRLALLSKGDIGRMEEFASHNTTSEREQLLDLLNKTGWNRREVARRLGVSEGAIRHRIKTHKLKFLSRA
jgi:DNA-binding NtrC family response regulator